MNGHEAADLLRHEARVLQAAEIPAAQRLPGSLPDAPEGLSRFTSSVLSGETHDATALLRDADEREERILRVRELLAQRREALAQNPSR
jgi:hypothetical protein